MNTLMKRLSRMEPKRKAPVAVVELPRTLDEDARRSAVAEVTSGLPRPFDVLPLQSTEATAPVLMFFGNFDTLLRDIARNSRRIGQPEDAA